MTRARVARPRSLWVAGILCLLWSSSVPVWGQAEPLSTEPEPAAPSPSATAILLELGEIRSITVDEVTRVAIGDPDVLDLTVISPDEILLQAKAVGTTNLILWDQRGQTVSWVEIVDRAPEKAEGPLRELVRQLDLPGVRVNRDGSKLFLIGEVPRQEDLDRVEQMLSAYEGVTNLVSVPAPPPADVTPPRSVTLTVQIIEMNRDAKDNLGIDWADSLTFTETTFGALGPSNVSQAARLGEAFRLGALSRTGFTPVLNMLVSNNKARILAEPKLVVASGKEATVIVGVEIPILTATSLSQGTVTQSIEFRQTGVELKFGPTIFGDGPSIELVISVKVSSIDTTNAITVSGTVVPGFRVRETTTAIVTESGRPVLIAGLIQDEEKKVLSQLPGIGNIPVLGKLFRSTLFTTNQTELVIIVTPTLDPLADVEQPAERARDVEWTTDDMEQPAWTDDLSATGPTEPVEPALPIDATDTAAWTEDPTIHYALQIQDLLAQALRYPSRGEEADQRGQVTLRIHLFRDGTLDQVLIAESSGIESFDQEALRAAESQPVYPPFPEELTEPDLWLSLPVLFHP